MKENKIQYSKLIPVVTGIIFIVCLAVAFTVDYSSVMDTTIYGIAISTSAGIFGTAILWYMKKAQTENTYKIKISLYREVASARLDYNEKMMELKNKYGMTDGDVYDIENESDMDELMSSALSDVVDSVDTAQSDATQQIETQNY